MNPNEQDNLGISVLMYAAMEDDTSLVKSLIDSGANVDLKSVAGQTALMKAAQFDKCANVKLLLEAGANIMIKDYQAKTALDYATDAECIKLLQSHYTSVESITELIEKGIYPNMYPNEQFVSRHRELIADYVHEIRAYKTFCFKELNTYYKTGEVVVQDCTEHHLKDAISKAGKHGLSLKKQVIFVAKRLEKLWKKVVPLPHDIIVYRGIKRGTIGQNMFTGKCIKSRAYNLDMHRFCTDEDLEDPRFWNDRKPNEDPRPYVYETLGFTSATTDIRVASEFAKFDYDKFDTIMALKLPAGTKFILPLSLNGKDEESELLLFPQHNTYVLNNIAFDEKVAIYIGTFCNDLNVYRPIGSPKLRNLKIKDLNPTDWIRSHVKKNRWLAFASDNDMVCPIKCSNILHFCDPETKKCLGDKPETLKKIQDWWRRKNIKGKCTSEKVNSCVDKFLACDPDTGDCIPGPYIRNEANKALNWATPDTIKAEQKPRYDCTTAKINKCANERKLCDPYRKGNCVDYNIHDLYWFNNGLPGEELKKFLPDGSCTAANIDECSKYNVPCDPELDMCMYNMRKHKWDRVLSRQEELKSIVTRQQ